MNKMIGTVIIFFVSLGLSAKAQNELPLEYFNRLPLIQSPSISPDGKKLVSIINQDDETRVMVSDFNGSNSRFVAKLGADKYRIEWVRWANNTRLLINVTQPLKLGIVRLRSNHLYAVNDDGKNLLEFKKKLPKGFTKYDAYVSAPRLLSILDNDDDHILVTTRDKTDGDYSSVFKVNINTGEFSKYIANTHRFHSWAVNTEGEINLVIGAGKNKFDNKDYIFIRNGESDDWKLIKETEDFQTETFVPQLFDEASGELIVKSDHKLQKEALWVFDVNAKSFKKLLAEAPNGLDIESAIIRKEKNTRKLVGFTYNDGFIRRYFFDDKYRKEASDIQSAMNKTGYLVTLYDWSDDENRFILYGAADNRPGRFFLLDKAKRKITPWFSQYPELNKQHLPHVKDFTFKASDGMKIHGYLTMPLGVDNPPVVLFPHGGPFARDSKYFDPFVQMFANRGYAVIQVNFRGSTGYGNAYHVAGYGEWGRKMQSDLIEAFHWVAKKNKVNASKSCIVGASYGGYAALVAGYQTPKLFKCIVSIAGVSDLDEQIRQWKIKGARQYVENAVYEDSEQIKKYSPIHHVSEFEVPVLLIHGQVDTRVKYTQSEEMYHALREAGKKVEYKELEYGTHSLTDSANRREAMKLLDEFLREYLK